MADQHLCHESIKCAENIITLLISKYFYCDLNKDMKTYVRILVATKASQVHRLSVYE